MTLPLEHSTDEERNYWLWLRGCGWRRVCKNEALIALHGRCSKDWGFHFRGGYDAETVARSFDSYSAVLDRDGYFWLSHLIRIERFGHRPESYYLAEKSSKTLWPSV